MKADSTEMTTHPNAPVQANRSIRTPHPLWLAVASLVLATTPGSAQTAGGALVSGSIAAAVIESDVQPSLQGFIGYRFNRALGIGVELGWLPSADGDLLRPLRAWHFPDPYGESEGDILTFTTNVRVEIPTTFRRVLPFVVGGGGVASVSRDYDVEILDTPVVLEALADRRQRRGIERLLPPGVVFPSIFPPPSTTSTGLALTLGGGVSLLVTDHLSFDIDLRALHIRGAARQTIGRFGAGASYRF